MARSLLHPIQPPGRWLLAAVLLWACRGQAEPASQPADTAVKRYTVHAEVLALPPNPGGDLVVRHEAIPEFTNASGAVVGMPSMVMPFPVAPGLSLAAIAPGDKIELVFSIDWTRGRYLIEKLTKLPATTTLKLGATQDPAAKDAAPDRPKK